MKKMKSMMPLTAFGLAVAFAFASVNDKGSLAPIEYVQSSTPVSCNVVTANCEGDEELCKFSTDQVYAERDGTICSVPLMRDKQ